jgi:hypothetical protein
LALKAQLKLLWALLPKLLTSTGEDGQFLYQMRSVQIGACPSTQGEKQRM